MAEPETLRVHKPLTLRIRGGRPRILPPKELEVAMDRGQDARLLRAIGGAWDWRFRQGIAGVIREKVAPRNPEAAE